MTQQQEHTPYIPLSRLRQIKRSAQWAFGQNQDGNPDELFRHYVRHEVNGLTIISLQAQLAAAHARIEFLERQLNIAYQRISELEGEPNEEGY